MTISRFRWPFYVVAAALVFAGVASVAYALGAASRGDALGAQPTTIPGHQELGPGWLAPNGAGRGFYNMRGGAVTITITKICGSMLSLQTTDGWTRTIDATGATITRGGQSITLGDLKVGDQISFRESRQADGTYKITSITVLVPTVTGTVTAVTSSSVTVTQQGGSTKALALTASTTYSQAGVKVTQSALVVGDRIVAQGTVDSAGNFTATSITIAPSVVLGTVASKTATSIVVTTTAGKTVTVNVLSSTTYSIRGVPSATLANVAVGNRIEALGTLNADGSLTAGAVVAGPDDQPGFGPGFGRGFGGVPVPAPTPAASGSNL